MRSNQLKLDDIHLEGTSKSQVGMIGVPSSVSPRIPQHDKKLDNMMEDDDVPDGIDAMDSDEDDEGQNVYYIDNENIMGINSPNTG